MGALVISVIIPHFTSAQFITSAVNISECKEVDIRIIATTNQSLFEMVKIIHMPPLRKRKEDRQGP